MARATTSATSASATDVPETTVTIPPELLSLLSSYYPSVVNSDLPATVVVDSETLVLASASSTASSPSSTSSTSSKKLTHSSLGASTLSTSASTSPASSRSSSVTSATSPTASLGSTATKGGADQLGDKQLAIVLGVVLGTIALLLMLILFCCLWRRRRRGTRDERNTIVDEDGRDGRATSSYSSKHEWIPPTPPGLGTTTSISAARGGVHDTPKSSFLTSVLPVRDHPAHRAYSRSDRNAHPSSEAQQSLVGRQEPPSTTFDEDAEGDDLGARALLGRTDVHDDEEDERPATPFLPSMFKTPARKPVPTGRQRHDSGEASGIADDDSIAAHDDEQRQDLISPVVPARNPERRNSPVIHYPSFDEIDGFDFAGRRAQDRARAHWHREG